MRTLATLTAGAILTAASMSVSAVPMTYFGEDLGWYSTNVSTNSDAASAAFQASLIGVGTEDFESFAAGTTAPLVTDFGAAGTATLTGGGVVYSGSNGGSVARRAYSGTNYWETNTQDFTITFSNAVAAFGFYGIDLGDFNGQVTVDLTNGGTTTYNIPHTQGTAANGALLFWGIIDTTDLFTSVTFSNTGSSADYLGFDDFTIGSREQVIPTPAPAPLALLSLGLLGLWASRRRQAM
jgi:hypothetical protein